jgi:hypothetical protein
MLSHSPEGAGTASKAARPGRPAPACVTPERLFGRVAQMVADAPLVSGLGLPWRSRS